MKKILITAVIIMALLSVILTGCSTINYGNNYNTMAELQEYLISKEVNIKYPGEFDGDKNIEYNYVAAYNNTIKEYIGYKIYRFSSPFYVSVYGYNHYDKAVMSDNIDRLTAKGSVSSSIGDINIYTGDSGDDSLFVIGVIDIDGHRYECRVTADNQRKDNKLINAITDGSENYNKSIELIKDILISLR